MCVCVCVCVYECLCVHLCEASVTGLFSSMATSVFEVRRATARSHCAKSLILYYYIHVTQLSILTHTQSQAHHGFRRASDTLIMSKPAQPLVKYSPTLTPHRERSLQVIPDATMEGASIAKKIGKGILDSFNFESLSNKFS